MTRLLITILAGAATAVAYEAASGPATVICTTGEYGFDMLVDGEAGQSFLNWTQDNTLVDGEDLEGYDADLRELLFTGKFESLWISPSLYSQNYSYVLRWTETFSAALVLTRMGVCDMAMAPFTLDPSRSTCHAETSTLYDEEECRPVRRCNITTSLAENGEPCVPGRGGWEEFSGAQDCCIDFSIPLITTGFSVLYEQDMFGESKGGMDFIFTSRVLNAFNFLILTIVVAGNIIWMLERIDNEDDFPKPYLEGVSAGMWWSAVTVTTVGFGDKAPRSCCGKLFGFFWMFAGLMICAYFTGTIASGMAESAAESNDVQGYGAFSGLKVCTVPFYKTGLVGEFMAAYPVDVETRPRLEDCLASFEKGDVDGVWYDKPILDYLTIKFEKQDEWGTTPMEESLDVSFAPVFSETPRPKMIKFKEDFENAIITAMQMKVTNALQKKWFHSGGSSSDGHAKDEETHYELLGLTVVSIAVYGLLFLIKEIKSQKARSEFMNKVKGIFGLRAHDLDKDLIKVSSSDDKLDAVLKQLQSNQQMMRILFEHNGLKLPDASQPLPEAHDRSGIHALMTRNVAMGPKDTKAAPSSITPVGHTM